jgi:prevent-host-death family protein
MIEMAMSEARRDLAHVVNLAAYGGERILLLRNGKSSAVLVSVDDASILEKLEDRLDLERIRQSLKEGGRHSLEDVKAELGL